MNNLLRNKGIRSFLSFFFVLFAFQTAAQEQQLMDEQCATPYIEQKQIEQLGIYGSQEYFEVWLNGRKNELRQHPERFRTQASGRRQIPVVVHVIHHGTPVGEGANIPFSQIQAQIDVLNEDYGKMNPDAVNTPDEFKAVAGDANIEFVLAKQDPNGLPSNGVNRVLGSKANYTPDDAPLIGQLALWPPEDYMNIWVVPLQPPYLGYSSFPISELPGLDFPASTRETDGVTIDYRYFGEGGNAVGSSAGRTATHEVGHYFGLRHIWGDGGCEVDDFVEDTPNQSQSNNTCLATPRITCGSRDMVENFMDYTPDQCMTLFTQGQVERIDVVLNFSPRRASLVNGKGTRAPQLSANDLSLSKIIDPQDFSCSQAVTPKVSIVNVGNNRVTTARLEVTLNGNRTELKDFVLNLDPGETGELTLAPISLPSSRENIFEVEIISVNGRSDSDPSNNRLQTRPRIQQDLALPYSYKTADFSGLWTLKNPDDATTWQQIQRQIDGQRQALIYLNGYNYETQGELDYLISPPINLTEAPDAQLIFKMAFAPYTDEEFQESLLVAVSTDCGNTFELLEAPYYKHGNSLKTVEPATHEFFPDSEAQFRTELVNLAAFAGESDVRIAFIAINGFGNNIFIKDVEIHPSVKYRYDFEIDKVLNPGPVNDGTQGLEVLQIENTGNLPISQFVIRRTTNSTSLQTFDVEVDLLPGESTSYGLPNSLSSDLNRVEYEILLPNYDQNEGSSSRLLRYFVQDDSSAVVPWRQDFDNSSDLYPWLTINPENNSAGWEVIPAPSGEPGNKVLALDNGESGNSFWLASPLFDLSGTPEASVFFDWASAGFTNSDRASFSVLISEDGGNSYNELWKKENGEINASSGGSSSVSEGFQREFIDLSAFTGEGFEKVRLAFKAEYQSGGTKPIYLDNIELFLSANPNPVDPGLGNTIVFPNPATEAFNIAFHLEEYEDVNIQIISSSGQIIYDSDYPSTLNQTYPFNAALFSRGVYIIRITGDNISGIYRLIIR